MCMLMVSLEYLIIKIIHFISPILQYLFILYFCVCIFMSAFTPYALFPVGMSLAQPCLSDGQQPVWLFWVALCCAAPAPKKICEDSNITANHSLPQQGSTCKPQPLPAVTQTESRGHAWHHPLFSPCKSNKKTIMHTHMQSFSSKTLLILRSNTRHMKLYINEHIIYQ